MLDRKELLNCNNMHNVWFVQGTFNKINRK